MKKNVVIIGAGGHAKVIAEMIEQSGDRVIGYLDDRDPKWFPKRNVLGKISDLGDFSGKALFVIAIGDNAVRKRIDALYPVRWYTARHPSAQVSMDAELGDGTVVMANAVVNSAAKVGRHCILNTASVIEHDCLLRDYVHIAPGAVLGGTVTVGEGTQIGLGASIRNNISICQDCIIGAGAVVTKDIREKGTYAGVPAKKISETGSGG